MNLAPHPARRLARLSGQLTDRVDRWAVDSQQRSRRNAMIASTALAQRRAVLDDVEEFLASTGRGAATEVAAQAAHG